MVFVHGRLTWFFGLSVNFSACRWAVIAPSGIFTGGKRKERKERETEGERRGGGAARGWELEVGNTAHHGRLTLFFGLSVNFSARTALEERLL